LFSQPKQPRFQTSAQPRLPSAAGLAGAALEAVIVGIARLVDAEQLAEVVEVALRAGALGERVALPAGDELFRRHAGIMPCGTSRSGA
jgi:hypothetical protein